MPRREFEAQFSDGTVEGSSFERRPDAVSRSYLQALAPGPTALGDPSKGLLVKGWYCRADNTDGKVYVAPAKDDTSLGWWIETELFSYAGDDIVELSFAFDQNGSPVVCTERADGHLWIHYFKPGVGDYVFEDFGDGTTPRMVLDDPQHVTDSDILIFYSRDGELRVREQRDLYVQEISPGNALTGNQYIEGALRDGSNRVHVVIATRDSGLGTYLLSRISSQFYPFYLPEEELNLGNSAISGLVEVVLIVYTCPDDEDQLAVANASISGDVVVAVWGEDAGEDAELVPSIVGVTINEVLIQYIAPDDEDLLDVANASISGGLEVALIEYIADEEELNCANSSISGTIVVP